MFSSRTFWRIQLFIAEIHWSTIRIHLCAIGTIMVGSIVVPGHMHVLPTRYLGSHVEIKKEGQEEILEEIQNSCYSSGKQSCQWRQIPICRFELNECRTGRDVRPALESV